MADYGFGKPMEGYNNEPDGIGVSFRVTIMSRMA